MLCCPESATRSFSETWSRLRSKQVTAYILSEAVRRLVYHTGAMGDKIRSNGGHDPRNHLIT